MYHLSLENLIYVQSNTCVHFYQNFEASLSDASLVAILSMKNFMSVYVHLMSCNTYPLDGVAWMQVLGWSTSRFPSFHERRLSMVVPTILSIASLVKNA